MLGSNGTADIVSLIKGGFEIPDCNFSFQQGVDQKGKATTRVYGGAMQITLPQLPPPSIVQWALKPKKYEDGVIVVVDAENVPLEKIIFKNASCTSMEIDYTQRGSSYSTTKIIIQTEKLIVGDGIDFENEWIY